MTIYRSVAELIKYELTHREEVKERFNYDDETYFAYMTGRMTPIIDMILDKDSTIAD